MVKLTDGRDLHRKENGTIHLRYRKMSPSNKKAEIGSFPLVSQFREDPFYLESFILSMSLPFSYPYNPQYSPDPYALTERFPLSLPFHYYYYSSTWFGFPLATDRRCDNTSLSYLPTLRVCCLKSHISGQSRSSPKSCRGDWCQCKKNPTYYVRLAVHFPTGRVRL